MGKANPIPVAIIPPPALIPWIRTMSFVERRFCPILAIMFDMKRDNKTIVGAIHGPTGVAMEVYAKIAHEINENKIPLTSTIGFIFLKSMKNVYIMAK